MELLYRDKDILVCIKEPGVCSTDEPGGVPELARLALGDPHANVRTVHRLDQVVSGLMVLARRSAAASELSRQIRDGEFQKEYLAVVCGVLPEHSGRLIDLLGRNSEERRTFVADAPGKGIQEAILDYEVLQEKDGLSLVRITLITGRTHQIRVQFSSRGWPLWGDRKYGAAETDAPIALWSHRLSFFHPYAKHPMEFCLNPPLRSPWNLFFPTYDHMKERFE